MQRRKKIGFFFLGAWGHTVPLIKIVEYLLQNSDYEIQVHSPESNEGRINKMYPKLKRIVIEDGINQADMQKRFGTLTGLGNILDKELPKKWEKYFSLLPTDYDLIITDQFNKTAVTFAKKNKIKLIVNHPSPFKSMIEFFNLLDLQNSFSLGGFTIVYSSFFLSIIMEIMKMNTSFIVYKNHATIIVNSFFGFDRPIPLPPNIHPVGMLEKSSHTELEDEELLEWMRKKNAEKKEEFIYVAFGSIVKITKSLFLRVYEGLSKVGLPVIWAYRSNDNHETEIKDDNFFIRNWLPQSAILSHPKVKVFVTHGGWNSISESVCHSKPMAVLSFFGDQPSNAELIQKNKSGIALYVSSNKAPEIQFNFPSLTSKTITEKLQKMLENYEQYFRNVQKMQKINETHGLQKVKKIVDQTIEFGNEHLIDQNYGKFTRRTGIQTCQLMVFVFIVLTVFFFIF